MILRDKYLGGSAWKKNDMSGKDDWIYVLNQDELLEIEKAIESVDVDSVCYEKLKKEDFPLPTLSKKIDELRHELEEGRGFALWRGIPVQEWGVEKSSLVYWVLGLHLGTSVEQNYRGELLGDVKNITSTDPSKNPDSRFYHTHHAAPFHVDGADVVGLLCLRPAKEGGASLLVSSTSIYNEILESSPELIDLMYEPLWFDHRGEKNRKTGKDYWECSIAGWTGEKLSLMYLRNFIESGQRYEGAPQLTAEHTRLLDRIDELAASDELCLSMDFQVGDIQWLNNHVTLHSRTSYEDWDEPEKKRWLRRLWLNFDQRDRFTNTYYFDGIAVEK